MTIDELRTTKKIAILAPVAWRTPPRQYGAWETVASNICEGLTRRGWDVTLFATADSLTSAKLCAVIDCGYEEDPAQEPKVVECLHIAELMEHAGEFDLIHNNYDFLPLTYSRLIKTPMLTTIHGFSSDRIRMVYRKYKHDSWFVSISDADRDPELPYLATVYNGIDLSNITFRREPGDKLLFLGRIHPDKGVHLAIDTARRAGMKLVIAGIIQDKTYFDLLVRPQIDGQSVEYIGPVGPVERDEAFKKPLPCCTEQLPERFGWSWPRPTPPGCCHRLRPRLLQRSHRRRQNRLSRHLRRPGRPRRSPDRHHRPRRLPSPCRRTLHYQPHDRRLRTRLRPHLQHRRLRPQSFRAARGICSLNPRRQHDLSTLLN